MFLFTHRGNLRTFQLLDGKFVYRGAEHDLTEVRHITFEHVHTVHQVNFGKHHESDSVKLFVHLASGDKIDLCFNDDSLLKSIAEDVEVNEMVGWLEELHRELAKETFQIRITPYLSDLEKSGCFVFDGATFDPSKRQITRDGETFSVGRDVFLRTYGAIQLYHEHPDAAPLWRKIYRWFWSSKSYEVNTLTDTDVILILLERFFNLRWD